ncbi:MAG: rRNA maturation RNase YbeY [Patescibacteria group bacterium]|nr:rRNA maturation RNase YbeY [Patescibacteria group bacterium]
MKQLSKQPEINIHGKIPSIFSEQKIKNIVVKTLRLSKSSALSIGIAFVGPVKMSSYNKLYRKKNKPTDVLSFAYHKSKKPNQNIEGDIIICPSFVKSDIKGSVVKPDEQLKRLLIHGILHLSGLDHAKDDEAEQMFAKQEKILLNL